MHTAMAGQVLSFQSSSVQSTTGGETKKTVDQQPLFRLLLTYRTEVGQALDCDGSTRVHIIAHDLARDQWQERFAGGTGWIYGIPSGTDDDGSDGATRAAASSSSAPHMPARSSMRS